MDNTLEKSTICKIYPNKSFLKKNFPYKFTVTTDDFTKQTVVQCQMTRTGVMGRSLSTYGFEMGNINVDIIKINFENIYGKYYLLMYFEMKELKVNKQCSLHLLMDNGNVITLTPIANPTKGVYHLCKFQLSVADMDELENSKFIKWRITNGEGVAIRDGMNSCCLDRYDKSDTTLNLSYEVFQDFIRDFRQVVRENIKQEEQEESTKEQSCFVYLMIDTTNNFHKIGISNKPQYREHTLQSDKPTIELLCAKEYPTRAIAEAIEESLHKVFASKRIRGEWFNLSPTDIDNIKQTLK